VQGINIAEIAARDSFPRHVNEDLARSWREDR